jgi:hypothetical protein
MAGQFGLRAFQGISHESAVGVSLHFADIKESDVWRFADCKVGDSPGISLTVSGVMSWQFADYKGGDGRPIWIACLSGHLA